MYALGGELYNPRYSLKAATCSPRIIIRQYALYTSLVEEIEGLWAEDKAKGKRSSELLSAPDKVMEWLDNRGTINDEWTKLKDMIHGSNNLDAQASAMTRAYVPSSISLTCPIYRRIPRSVRTFADTTVI